MKITNNHAALPPHSFARVKTRIIEGVIRTDKNDFPRAKIRESEMQRAVHDWILRPVTPIAATRRLTDVERRIVHDKLEDGMRRFHSEYGFDVAKWGFDV